MRISVASLTLFLAAAANVGDAFVVAPRGAFTSPSTTLWSSPSEDGEGYGGEGGSRFREMMEKAKSAAGPTRQPGQPDPFAEAKAILEQPTEYEQQLQQQQQPQVLYDQHGNPVQLPPQPQYFDQDGNPVALPAQPAQPVAPQRVKQGGDRKVGRNRDADAIANTADVYFAQLKRDSTIRTTARQAGDVETANNPMAHPDLDKMKDLINNNPYLNAERAEQAKEEEEQYRKLMELLETSEDEMLPSGPTLAEFKAEEERKKEAMKGPSYKDKLMAAKNRQRGAGAAAPVAAAPQPAQAAPVAPTPPPAEPVAPVAATPPPVAATPPPVVPATPPPVAPVTPAAPASVPPPPVAPATTAAPASASPAAAASAAAAAAAAQQATAMVSEDDIRRKIRVLMGLILKHRGGPGFGSGRLKLETEIDRFQDALADIKALLRSEADMDEIDSVVPPHSAPPPVAAVSPPPAPPAPAAPAPVEIPPAQSAPAPPSLEMPPEMRGTAACVEAALQLYRDAKTPEEREALMIPLRAALMSAVNNCNQIIAENEVQNKAAYEQRVAPAPPPVSPPPPVPEPSAPVQAGEVASNIMGFPSSYAVTQVTEEEETTQQVTEEESDDVEEDTNTPILSRVRSDLENVSGVEKFGLKKLNSDEAEKLKDSIIEMRSILMEELDKGIPGKTTP